MQLETNAVKSMSAIERSEAQMRVAMSDEKKLREWLRATNRTWLVFNALDLVDALPWPDGVEMLIQIIACYRDHRAAIPTGETTEMNGVELPVMKDEFLTVPELDRAIRNLVGQITEKDPTWKLTNPPL